MSGPPKFRDRDMTASLSGAVDSVVLLHICVWLCGGLWVLARLYPSLLRRGTVPAVNRVQVIGALLIAALSLSLWQSPGFLLTAFTLGQFAVMLCFAWVFTDRFGPSTYLRYLFAGVCVLALMLIAAAFLTPELVIWGSSAGPRFRGERIASTGAVAVMGLVLCLANIPPLRSATYWGSVVVFGVLLATSRMRTAYVAMLAYLVVGWVFGRRLRVRTLAPLLVVFSVGLFLLDAWVPTTTYIVRETYSIETMSDRIPLWRHLTNVVMRDEPLIGLGYFAASRVVAPQYNARLGTAHSAFFEYLVGGGLVGATLYLVLCASLLWYAGRLLSAASGQPGAVAAVGLLVVVLVMGITSTEATHAGPVGFTFWSMTALLPTMCRNAESHAVFHTQRLSVRSAISPAHAATRQSSSVS
jgi:hypothetical protein